MKKKIISALLVGAMAMSILAGCGGGGSDKQEADAGGEKTKIKFYGKVVEYTSGPMMTDALEEKMADKYDIESIQVDWANLDKVIRTGIASGDPCDVYCYAPQNMANFADMAVDLTPYLEEDPEWKAQFTDEQLAAGTVDGKILSVPWESNFSVILANKTKLDEMGIKIPEAWTMTEFMDVCQKIKDAGLWPFANATDLNRADWIFRNAMLSEVITAGKYEEFTKGEISYLGEEATKALESTKALYDKGYMYPGEGAVTAKGDEIKAAFYQGDLLMMPEIAAGAKATADEVTDFEVVAIPWPSSNTEAAVLGGMNGLFIPQNSKNIDAAVEVLKAFTSVDIQTIHAEQGYIPTNGNVEITDEFVKSVVAQGATVTAPEDPATPEMNEYKANQLMPDLILNGGVETAAQGLEAVRTAK